MPGRLKRVTRPAIAIACVVALTLSFVGARAGGEPQADETAVPAITPTKAVAATTTSALGPARGLPALAPERPKPPKRKPARPAPPAPRPAAPAPAPAAPPAAPEPAYTPPPVPVVPAQPPPEPAQPPAPPPQPDPSPPVYFDDSG
jgi:hypothetical protein